MTAKSEPELVAEFFYNGYTRAWPGATLQQMFPIYVNEINRLFAALESKEPYYQEFARDYPLATELRSKVSGDALKHWVQPTDARTRSPFYVPPSVSAQPYSIIPTASGIVFKRYTEQVLNLSYRSFFNYLEHYTKLLRQNFPDDMTRQDKQDMLNEQRLESLRQELKNPNRTEKAKKEAEVWIHILESSGHWEQRLKHLRSLEWSKLFNKITSTLQFWKSDEIEGDPNKIYTGSKKLSLRPGALVSFKQLDCPDTLTSLTADALYNYKDLNELGRYVNLRTLALRHMHIKDISFVANLTNLDELILYNNEITDISPISNLPRLTHLYLVGNKIKDFAPLFTLPHLKTLYLDDGQFTDKKEWEQLPCYVNLNIVHIKPHEGRSEDGIPKFIVDLVEQRSARGHYKGPKGSAILVENSNAGNNSTQDTNSAQSNAQTKQQQQLDDPRKLTIRDRYLYSGITNSLGHTPAVRYDVMKLKHLDCSNTIELQPDHTFLDQPGDFSCLQYATALRTINLNDRLVNDFRFLSNCSNLKEVSLARTAIDDLFPLFKLHNLQRLNLCGCEHLILDKDTISWLLTVPNLEVDAKLSKLLFDKVFAYFLGQCQDFGISPLLRNELSTDANALQKERSSPRHASGRNIFDFDIFNLDEATSIEQSKLQDQEQESGQYEQDTHNDLYEQEEHIQVANPLNTLLNTELLPSELAFYFQNMTLWGFRLYLQFVSQVKEWDGTINNTLTSLWLITPNSVFQHPCSYPWLKPFNQYGSACEKYIQAFKNAAQCQLEIFEQMLPIIYSTNPKLTKENEEEMREELKYQIRELNLIQDYPNPELFWDDFFADYNIEIKDKLEELYAQFVAVAYPKRPVLDRFWRNHLPFLVTFTPQNHKESAGSLSSDANVATSTKSHEVIEKNPALSNTAYGDLLRFTDEGYTAYLLAVDSGQIYRLTANTTSKKPSAELIAPNMLFFLHNWPKLILPSSQPSHSCTWEA